MIVTASRICASLEDDLEWMHSVLVWEKWLEPVKQLYRGMHDHQKKTLALVVLGIILAGIAVLQRMAESVQLAGSSAAKKPGIERRFARFVANDRIIVSEIWECFLSQVLPYWHGKAVRLKLDGTPCGKAATIVYVGLLVHSGVLPLMWRLMSRPRTEGRVAMVPGW